jgi:hypothetical protein
LSTPKGNCTLRILPSQVTPVLGLQTDRA